MKITRGRFKGCKIIFASDVKIAPYRERVYEMLKDLLDLNTVLITDESSLNDFGIRGDTIQRLHDEYGVDVSPHDTLLSIAERIWK